MTRRSEVGGRRSSCTNHSASARTQKLANNEQRTTNNELIVALDVPTKKQALSLCKILKPKVSFFKVGLELFLSEGESAVKELKKLGVKIFLDLKLCDIPNQVQGAVRQIVRMKVDMFSLHTTGGFEMMKEAARAARTEAKKLGVGRPKILGVTVLTSLDAKSLRELGVGRKLVNQVVSLATLAHKAKLDGVVASPWEVSALRKALDKKFLIVAPGVRLKKDGAFDQKRIFEPGVAIKKGASFVVVGRPIIEAAEPLLAAETILTNLEENLDRKPSN